MNRETSIHSSDTLIVTNGEARRRRRWLIIGAVVAAVLIALLVAKMMSGSAADKKAADAAASAGQVPSVTVIVPGTSQVARTISASGPLAARREQPIGIAGQGGRVVRVLVDAGSWVRAGQTLAVVDRSVQAQQAAQLAAQVEAARAEAALAQSSMTARSRWSPRFRLEGRNRPRRTRRRATPMPRRVRVAQAQLGATRAQIGQLNIVAPSSGLILERNVELGQIVSPGSPALFRLAEGGAMEMRAQLSQQDLAFIHTGMAATVTPIGSTQGISGSVWQVAPMIDAQSRLGEVRIAIPYTAAIRPGGFAEARVTAGATIAPLLPQSAVLSDDKGNYVYIINRKNEVERRPITIGTVDDSGVTIASGLSGSEPVVLSAGPFLNPGQKVNPKRQAAR